jgi:magnesium chelatase subunit H
VLGTQMERHIAKRAGVPCAVISAPVHVQDFPARYSPQMGFEGANVIFDTWVHPLMMGLEEHLLAMFRDDFEFSDEVAPSHLGGASLNQEQKADHCGGAVERARRSLARDYPGLTLDMHAATAWDRDPENLDRCKADIAKADIVIATMLFMEDHIQAVLPDLQARRDHCDAMVGCLSAPEISRCTRLGRLDMQKPASGPMAFLKKLRGNAGKPGNSQSAGASQLKMLRRIPKILRFIPGTAQDLRSYLLTLQYWLACSDENVANMIRALIDRYADGPRRALRGVAPAAAPTDHFDVGVYHPRMKKRVSDDVSDLPSPDAPHLGNKGVVGLLLMRSYVLSRDSAHYDAVIAAVEARGLKVIPAFAGGLDARPAVNTYFLKDGKPTVDAVISLTGFSLVGGPAYNDAKAAEELLASVDVPYISANATEFQPLEQWEASARGLMPVETTMMIAIPEIDGATGPILFAGRSSTIGPDGLQEMQPHLERVDMLARRVARIVAMRRTERSQRRIAITLFNFPPNGGATGTAAFLAVFESLYHTLEGLKAAGYQVELPENVDALRDRVLKGNADRYGTDANVVDRISADDHVRRERYLAEIEAQWGPAPGRQQSDGSSILVLGERFGNVLVGVQPAFGYEGDPMRLLFEGGFAPTHAFSAYYRYLREDFGAHAVLHFGTHGALEFMPGKHSGLSARCWPDRLIGDLPNFYLYAANNPSEGMIAKRRSAATLVSYLTPPVAHAGLYRGLIDLKSAIERFRTLPPESVEERRDLSVLIRDQAVGLELALVDGDDEAVVGGAAPRRARIREHPDPARHARRRRAGIASKSAPISSSPWLTSPMRAASTGARSRSWCAAIRPRTSWRATGASPARAISTRCAASKTRTA